MKQKKQNRKIRYYNDYQMIFFFLILMTSGFFMGLYLSKYIDISDQNILSTYMSVLIDKTNPNDFFTSQFMLGSISILLVVILSTSLLGIPLISFIIYTKGVQIGFSCALFIYTYSYKGIIGILMVFLPQTILDVLSFYIVVHFSLHLSIHVISSSITTATIPLKQKLNELLSILIVSFLLIFVSSYFKSTIGIELIRIFENL